MNSRLTYVDQGQRREIVAQTSKDIEAHSNLHTDIASNFLSLNS